MKNNGFTLIEVLVVIAIVGVLSSIIIGNVNRTRAKAVDAKTKIEMSSLRRSADLYYNGAGNETYGALSNSCDAPASMFYQDATMQNIILGIYYTPGVTINCRSNGITFAVSADLVSILTPTLDIWCIDSKGAARAIDNHVPANTFLCP